MVLAATLSMLRYIGGSDDRDFVDRLHSYFTCNILIALSILVSFKQFGGKPVECLVPDMFSSSWEQYAENYCWAQDTYYVPMDEPVAGLQQEERRQRKISYYQWVPFFLLLEAACFRLPSLLWKYLSGHSGIKICEIVKLSSDPNNIKPDIKRANIKALTTHLQGALRFHKRLARRQIRPHKFFFMCNMPYSAAFVSLMYITTKFFYLVNVCLQLLLMNKFLETDKYNWYGLGAVVDLLNGKEWKQSGVFPRVSLCDFDVRVMGNVQEHTIQCVLVINIFNEKIFIFLWFWFLGLLVFTAGSFLYWLFVFVIPIPNRRFIIRHLEMSDMPFDPSASETDEKVDKFVSDYLKSDGVFVLRMLTLQSGVIFGTDLTVSLWKSFFGIEQLHRSNSVPGPTPSPSRKMLENISPQREEATGRWRFVDDDGSRSPPLKSRGGNEGGEGTRSREDSRERKRERAERWKQESENDSNDLRHRFGATSRRGGGADGNLGITRGGTTGETRRLIPPPAPPPSFLRHVALVRGDLPLNDPNASSTIVQNRSDGEREDEAGAKFIV